MKGKGKNDKKALVDFVSIEGDNLIVIIDEIDTRISI